MDKKPSYDELEKRIKKLEEDTRRHQNIEENLLFTQFAIDHASVSAFWLKSDGHFFYVNNVACQSLGYSREELLNMTVLDIDPNFTSATWKEHWTEIQHRGSFIIESRHRTKDGRIYPVEITVNYLEYGGKGYNCAFARDITDHKISEKTMRENEARYREIVEHTNNGVAVYRAVNDGEDFIFVDFNKSCERIEQVKRDDVIGRSVLELFPGVKEFGLFDVFKKVWETGDPQHHTISLYRDERVVGWRENFVYKLPSGEIVAVYSDETERKQAEENLKMAHEELMRFSQDLEEKVQERTEELREKTKKLIQAERMATAGKIANRVAHELRNSLTVVGGFSRRLNEKTSEDNPDKEYLEIIFREVQVLERKVSEIIKLEVLTEEE